MKLDPNEVQSIKDQFPRPELGEVTPNVEEVSSVESSTVQQAQSVSATASPNSLAVSEAIEETGDETVDSIQALTDQQIAASVAMMVALDKLHKGTMQVHATLGRIFGLMFDEKYAPKASKWNRPAPLDNTAKEMEPGDGTGESLLGGIGGLLGAAAAALAGKSLLGSVFGRKGDAPKGKPSTVQPKSRMGGWIDKIRGKTPTPTTTVPETSTPKPSPAGAKPSTVPTPESGATKARPKLGGRMALVAGAGALAYGAYEVVSNSFSNFQTKVDDSRNVSSEERDMQAQRRNQGLAPLEGKELAAYRATITERNGLIPNTNTGMSLSRVQSLGVTSGLLTAQQASNMTNDEVYDVLQANGVSANYHRSKASDSSDSSGGGVLQYADELAITGAGMYVAKKASDRFGSTTATVPETLAAPTPKPTNAAPASFAKAPLVDKAPKAAVPSDAELKQVKAAIQSTAKSSIPTAVAQAETAAAGGGKGMLKSGLGKALPIVGTALTAYDAAQIITDEKATTRQKAGSLADLAGGTAGAIIGAKAGAGAGAAVGAGIGAFFFGAGAVPGAAIGAAIGGIGGGIAGYLGGSGITKSVREWMFGDDVTAENIMNAQPATTTAAGPASDNIVAVGDQTEQAFNTIVNASKPQNNQWVSSVTGIQQARPQTAQTAPVGIGVLKANPVGQPTAVNKVSQVTAGNAPAVSNTAQPTSVANISNFSSQPAAEPVVREQFNPVKETYVVNQPQAKQDREQSTKLAKDSLINKPKNNNNTAVTRIDDVPSVMQDGGLGLMNVGLM